MSKKKLYPKHRRKKRPPVAPVPLVKYERWTIRAVMVEVCSSAWHHERRWDIYDRNEKVARFSRESLCKAVVAALNSIEES